MTGIGKIRRKVSANSNEPFHSRKNCGAVSIGISLEFSPADQGQVQDSRSSKNKKQPRPNESKPGEREKSCLLGAGGYGKCTGEDFFNQLSQNWRGGSVRKRNKPGPMEEITATLSKFFLARVLSLGRADGLEL
jgi:hypothetical protein